MKKKVFWSLFLTSIITMVLTSIAIIAIIYANSTRALHKEVKAEAIFVSEELNTYENDEYTPDSYIGRIGRKTANRITVISQDGTVLYDNYAAAQTMDNHLSRPEVAEAVRIGTGDSTRHSDTIGEQIYYHAVKLKNGDILRIANTTKSAVGILGNAAGLVLFLIIYIFIIGMIIANTLTKSFLKPINNLNLDEPLKNNTYDELSPLLGSLEKKNKEIAVQIQKLSDKQKEFDYITSSMSEGLIIFDAEGNILSANKSAMDTLGNNGSNNAKNYLTFCRDPEYIELVESALKGNSTSGNLEKNNRIYKLTVSSVESDKHNHAAVLFMMDITEHEQAEKLRREFSANVSHELKTPLTSILGYAELIQNGMAKSKDIPQFAGRIHSEASRLLSLIEDIINLSRLDEADMKQEYETVDLYEVSKDVTGMLSDKAKTAGITLTLEGESSLINGVKPVLHEMVYNLCDNAIIYNHENGTVKVSVHNEFGKTVFRVKDSGIGIPPEHQNRIFERFYRVDKSHSKETGGTGLGLSIVKHGAILHNADITLESKTGEGTEIKIVFNSL